MSSSKNSTLKNAIQLLAINRFLTWDGFFQLPFAQKEVTQIATLISGKGEGKDRAWWQAKMNFLQNQTVTIKAHPYFWAGFALIGNADPISLKTHFPDMYLMILLPILVGVAGGNYLLKMGLFS